MRCGVLMLQLWLARWVGDGLILLPTYIPIEHRDGQGLETPSTPSYIAGSDCQQRYYRTAAT